MGFMTVDMKSSKDGAEACNASAETSKSKTDSHQHAIGSKDQRFVCTAHPS